MENWCSAVRVGALEQHPSALKLKATGSRFAKLNRLTAWLLGTYSPEDFAESSGNGYVNWVSRANLRKTFIDRVCKGELEHTWMNSAGDSDKINLLATANAKATVRRRLDEMHQRPLEQAHEDSRQEGGTAQIPEDPARLQTPLLGTSTYPEPLGLTEAQQEARPGWIPLLPPNGTAFTIPTELSSIITQLQKEMGVVKEKLNTLIDLGANANPETSSGHSEVAAAQSSGAAIARTLSDAGSL